MTDVPTDVPPEVATDVPPEVIAVLALFASAPKPTDEQLDDPDVIAAHRAWQVGAEAATYLEDLKGDRS